MFYTSEGRGHLRKALATCKEALRDEDLSAKSLTFDSDSHTPSPKPSLTTDRFLHVEPITYCESVIGARNAMEGKTETSFLSVRLQETTLVASRLVDTSQLCVLSRPT